MKIKKCEKTNGTKNRNKKVKISLKAEFWRQRSFYEKSHFLTVLFFSRD